MTLEFFDKAGKQVLPGDIIVYGHGLGRCAGLRYGKILAVQLSKTSAYEYDPKTQTRGAHYPVRLRVQGVDDDATYRGPVLCKPGTLSFESRVLKVRADQLPPAVAKLLANVEVP
jgi:hypothetical protein